MGKKDDGELAAVVKDLLENVGEDRDKLSDFIDKLLAEHGDQPAGIAEYIAKLMDASTRQNAVKVSLIKTLVKNMPSSDQDDEEMIDEVNKIVGLPFEDSDGAN